MSVKKIVSPPGPTVAIPLEGCFENGPRNALVQQQGAPVVTAAAHAPINVCKRPQVGWSNGPRPRLHLRPRLCHRACARARARVRARSRARRAIALAASAAPAAIAVPSAAANVR